MAFHYMFYTFFEAKIANKSKVSFEKRMQQSIVSSTGNKSVSKLYLTKSPTTMYDLSQGGNTCLLHQ